VATKGFLLDTGKFKTTVQWDRLRSLMSAITNISQASLGGLENSVGAYERSRMWILGSVTHKFWFAWFMSGVHKRAGQVRKPDKEHTINVIHNPLILWTHAGRDHSGEIGSP
jgi:hypothetical protein